MDKAELIEWLREQAEGVGYVITRRKNAAEEDYWMGRYDSYENVIAKLEADNG